MDSGIKVHKVPGVVLDGHPPRLVDLHLTPHHTILVQNSGADLGHTTGNELWISHSLLLSIHLQPANRDAQARTPLVIRSKDFECVTILFSKRSAAKLVYESLEAVLARRVSTDQLYAFCQQSENTSNGTSTGWDVYNPKQEFVRMGVFDDDSTTPPKKARTQAWRFTTVNSTYDYCPTYPAALVVPSKISDATLNYGKSYRSKFRIPGLVYLHWANLGSITRSSQPMVGLKNARSIQDEKLIEAIFNSHSYHHYSAPAAAATEKPISDMANASYMVHSQQVYGATSTNLIIDARPTTNAMANVAKGAGTENMEYYRNCKKVYLGIDNIHVMRDSLARVAEALRLPDQTNYDLLRKSNWLKHLSCILEGIIIIVRAVHLANSHVLVHCSDGWDRTSQLSSLSQLCLDPYYRTMKGFAVLVEKDWVSYGHRFLDRYGHLVASRVQLVSAPSNDEEDSDEYGFIAAVQQRLNFSGSSHAFKETSPVFDQFLDTIHQLQRQFPERFEFNETFLLELQKQIYECKYGNFLYNSEKERVEADVSTRTASIWSNLLHPQNRAKYLNTAYVRNDEEVLFPDPKDVKWWTSWFKRDDMNLVETALPVIVPPEPKIIEDQEEDPVLRGITASPSKASPSYTNSNLPSEIASPTSSNNGLPLTLDSATMAQASTAVQGAMRSAWSAWRSVRQGYDGVVKEMTEGPIPPPKETSTPSHLSPPTSTVPSRSTSPSMLGTTPSYSYQPRIPKIQPKPVQAADKPASSLSPRWPPEDDFTSIESPQSKTAAANHQKKATIVENELEANPWKGGDANGDPLGVHVWS